MGGTSQQGCGFQPGLGAWGWGSTQAEPPPKILTACPSSPRATGPATPLPCAGTAALGLVPSWSTCTSPVGTIMPSRRSSHRRLSGRTVTLSTLKMASCTLGDHMTNSYIPLPAASLGSHTELPSPRPCFPGEAESLSSQHSPRRSLETPLWATRASLLTTCPQPPGDLSPSTTLLSPTFPWAGGRAMQAIDRHG